MTHVVHTVDGRQLPVEEYFAERRAESERSHATTCACGHRRGQHHGMDGAWQCGEERCACVAFAALEREIPGPSEARSPG